MREILFTLKYNKVYYRLIEFKPTAKIFRLSNYDFGDYDRKKKLESFFTVFKIFFDIFKHFIYLIILSAAMTIVPYQTGVMIVWVLLMLANNNRSQALMYDENTKILFLSFKIPFMDIYTYNLKRRALNRFSYVIMFLLTFTVFHPLYHFAVVGSLLILFEFYTSESFAILTFNKGKSRRLEWLVAITKMILVIALFYFDKSTFILIPYIIYTIISATFISKYESFDYMSDYLLKNIKDFDETMLQIGDMQSKEVRLDKKIDTSKSLETISKYRSYNLYQKIFLQRHRRIWYKPIKYFSIVQIVIYLGVSVFLFLNRSDSIALNTYFKHITSALVSIYIFAHYGLNPGERLVKAYYKNGDYNLLHYAFYRRQSEIYKQYLIRLKDAMKLAIVPSLITLIFSLLWHFVLRVYLPYNINFFILITFFACFFNMFHLFMYYLMQPYNIKLENKKIISNIFNFGIYMLVISDKSWLSYRYTNLFLIGFLLLMVIISTLLIYFFGHRTFVARD